jgi:phage FluMu gp28-like protein
MDDAQISDNKFSRFDDELIEKYFNDKGKKAIQDYIASYSREVRIDELNKMPSPSYIGRDGIRLELIAEYKNHRLAELKEPTHE